MVALRCQRGYWISEFIADAPRLRFGLVTRPSLTLRVCSRFGLVNFLAFEGFDAADDFHDFLE